MRDDTKRSPKQSKLRHRAEARVNLDLGDRPSGVERRDANELLYELQVHQVEIEAQNEELRRTQEDLEKARARYYGLFERAPIAYVTMDSTARILEANEAASALLGVPKSRLIGQRLSRYMIEADADRFHHYRHKLFSDSHRHVCELEIELETPDGAKIPVAMECVLVASSSGGEPYARCVILDMTRLLATQQELRLSEERFRDIADRVDAVLYVHDAPDGSICYVNPAYERIWGRPSSALYEDGTTWLDSIHADDVERVRLAHAAVLQGGTFDEEYRIIRPDGEIRWIRDRASPAHGWPSDSRIVGLAQDITEERKLEVELRHAQKMEAVGTLASGIAHDFNNVLQGILGAAFLAEAPGVPESERREHLRRVKEIAKRGGGLARRLLIFARKHEQEPKPIVLDEMLRDSAEVLSRVAGEHIEFVFSPGAPGAVILADPAEVEQVLMNLVANAVDAMPHVGTLTVATELSEPSSSEDAGHGPLTVAGRYVRLSVRDTGVGMDEVTKDRLFEPFFTTKDPGRGTGLGLATVFTVTQRMGAHIHIDSEVDRGTCVTVCFPKNDGQEVFREIEPTATLRGTVLLVEDDPMVCSTLERFLASFGLEVFATTNPNEAVEICNQAPRIDLVVSDVMMPKMLGPVLVEKLRLKRPDVPVLYISAHGRRDLIDRGILKQGEALLTKPFESRDLHSRLVKLMPSSLG